MIQAKAGHRGLYFASIRRSNAYISSTELTWRDGDNRDILITWQQLAYLCPIWLRDYKFYSMDRLPMTIESMSWSAFKDRVRGNKTVQTKILGTIMQATAGQTQTNQQPGGFRPITRS